jgi:hypothetical protein
MHLTIALFLSALLTADSTAERNQHWLDDLRFFAAKFAARGTGVDFKRGMSSNGQKDLAKLYPDFDKDLAAIEADVPKISDSEIVLRLMKLVAGANVAHNEVYLPLSQGFFERLPLTFAWHLDGLQVTGASADYEQTQGARVLKIGAKTPQETLAELAPYIGHENDAWLRQRSVGLLRTCAVLTHLGVANADGSVPFTLEKPGGAPFALTLPTVAPKTQKILNMTEALHIPVPLYQTHPDDKYYWYEYIQDSGTLYIQYNQCENDPKLKFSDFARQVLAAADANTPKRVVIDLRKNGGGDSRVIHPLASGLAARLNKIGHVFVLISPYTFSSGVMAATDLRRDLRATLVGEPTGGKPSSYGEIKLITLPNSQVKVQYTTKWFGSHQDSEPQALVPDISAQRLINDALAGRDPVLEAAIAGK